MLCIAGEITVDEASIDKIADAARKMVEITLTEKPCIAYSFSQSFNDPTCVRVFECWDDQAGLDAHFATPHMAEFQKAMQDITVTGMNIQKYEIASVEDMRVS